MSKIRDLVFSAVNNHDAEAAAYVSDVFQFKYGLNYSQIFKIVHDVTGVSKPVWDGLLYEADRLESLQ